MAAESVTQVDLSDRVRYLEEQNELKGILKLYKLILHFTEKFKKKPQLPHFSYLVNALKQSEDQVRSLAIELLGGGTFQETFLIAIPSLSYLNDKRKLLRRIVFAAYAQEENDEVITYIIDKYTEQNATALSKWFPGRKPLKGDKLKALLEKELHSGSLLASQAPTEIKKILTCQFDITPKMEKKSFSIHGKPVIRKMVDSGHLLLMNSKLDSDTPPITSVYFKNENELKERYEFLVELLFDKVLNKPKTTSDPEEMDLEIKKMVSEKVTTAVPHKQLMMEIKALCGYYTNKEKILESEQDEKKVTEIIKKLESEKSPVRLDSLCDPEEDIAERIMKHSLLLHAEIEERYRILHYVLHVNNASDAIKLATKKYKKTSNSEEAKILVMMKIERLLDSGEKKSFEKLLKKIDGTSKGWLQSLKEAMYTETEETAGRTQKTAPQAGKKEISGPSKRRKTPAGEVDSTELPDDYSNMDDATDRESEQGEMQTKVKKRRQELQKEKRLEVTEDEKRELLEKMWRKDDKRINERKEIAEEIYRKNLEKDKKKESNSPE